MEKVVSSLSEILNTGGSVTVRFGSAPKGMVSAMVEFTIKDDKETRSLPPIVIQGTYEELDNNLPLYLKQGAEKLTKAFIETEAFDEAVAQEAKKTRGKKAKAEPEKPAAPDLLSGVAPSAPAAPTAEAPKAPIVTPPPAPEPEPEVDEFEIPEPEAISNEGDIDDFGEEAPLNSGAKPLPENPAPVPSSTFSDDDF